MSPIESVDPFHGDGAQRDPLPVERQEEDVQVLDASARKAAIERGRLLGHDGADRASEEGEEREQRVARAMAYAAWEADGKPDGQMKSYLAEFGIMAHEVVPSAERAPSRLLIGMENLKEKKK